jgi:hypothetical protein
LFFFSFASLRGLESKRSVVIVGRICPLVDVEAGFIILDVKKIFLSREQYVVVIDLVNAKLC